MSESLLITSGNSREQTKSMCSNAESVEDGGTCTYKLPGGFYILFFKRKPMMVYSLLSDHGGLCIVMSTPLDDPTFLALTILCLLIPPKLQLLITSGQLTESQSSIAGRERWGFMSHWKQTQSFQHVLCTDTSTNELPSFSQETVYKLYFL